MERCDGVEVEVQLDEANQVVKLFQISKGVV